MRPVVVEYVRRCRWKIGPNLDHHLIRDGPGGTAAVATSLSDQPSVTCLFEHRRACELCAGSGRVNRVCGNGRLDFGRSSSGSCSVLY